MITHLRYVALGVEDLDRAAGFYEDVWQLVPAGRETGLRYFTAAGSPEPFILRLRVAGSERLDVVSFGAATPAGVDAVAASAARNGCRLVTEPGSTDLPGGGYAVRFFDPEGRTIEVSSDTEVRQVVDVPERTPAPVSLSHVVLNTADLDSTAAFFVDVLGFRISDWLEHDMCFLRCNEWHHSVALNANPYPNVNHVAYETRGIDEFLRASGKLMRRGVRLAWGPGRHGPGDNAFAYFVDPSGFVAEYTTGLERVDEDRQPRVFRKTAEQSDQWGTAGPRDPKPFQGREDDGLFHAPPV